MVRFVPMVLAAAVLTLALATPVSAQPSSSGDAHYSLDVPTLRLQVQVTTQATYEQQPVGYPQQSAMGGTHPDWGLVVTGAVLLGAGYLTSVVFGALGDNAILFIPVIGGFIHAPLNGTGGGIALGLTVSAVQVVGVILLIVGLVANIPNDPPRVASLVPRLVGGPGEAGGGLRWSF